MSEILDINNGSLRIGDTILGPQFSLDNFIDSKLYGEIIREDKNAFSRYFLKPQPLKEAFWSIALYFNEKRFLSMITMSILDSNNFTSWETWSENAQVDKKAKHDSWLLKSFGPPPYKFRWGEISSQFDPRSASSYITVRYP